VRALVEGGVSIACIAPVALLFVLGASGVAGNVLGERGTGLVTRAALSTALAGIVVALVAFVLGSESTLVLRYGTWFSSAATAFSFDLAIDWMSLGFAALGLLMCNVVASFSFRYLHREPGFHRYFVQMAMFVVGITLIPLAGSIEVLFVGWELVGLSSALLVGFFHERVGPVTNALRVFAVYRLSDAAMLSATVLLHHWAGTGSLAQLFSATPSQLPLESGQALAIAALLIVAVAGKSALWPLSGWLPRAMEGPTPSSAVYYGALSIHAGCFLLLRAQPLIEASNLAVVLVATGGLATAAHAAMTGRVQTDVKSAIAYATLTQVGIITVEIALGLRTIAFFHIVGHACFRLLQFLSAPNVLHDLHELSNRLGGHLPRETRAPDRQGTRIYLAALERGFADALVDRLFVGPLRTVVGVLDRFDRVLVGNRTGGRR
jgi:NAD(P)H-quinone oxidoreductase subunit 5